MSKHSPEPWAAVSNGEYPRRPTIIYGGPKHVAIATMDCDFVASVENGAANGHRIVSCVNACQSLNPEAVPELLAMLVEARKWIGSMGTIAVNADTKTQKEFGQLMGAYKTLPARLNAVIKKAGFVPPEFPVVEYQGLEKDYASESEKETDDGK